MALSATFSFKKSNWLECHHQHYLLLKSNSETLYYSRSFEIFESVPEIFYPAKVIKFWNWKRLSGIHCLGNVVILCGTNNIFRDYPTYIADCIVNIGSYLREKI